MPEIRCRLCYTALMCDADILSELAADVAVTDVLRSHGKISASQIIIKGEIRMALLTKDENGNVVEVLESRPVSLEDIQSHIDKWNAKKADYLALTGQTDTTGVPVVNQAPTDGSAAPTVPQAPVAPTVPPTGPTDGNVPINPVDPGQQQAPAAPVAPVDPNAAQAPVFPQ